MKARPSVEEKPFATITLEFYENRTLGVRLDGETLRVNQSALERASVMAVRRLQQGRREAFLAMRKQETVDVG